MAVETAEPEAKVETPAAGAVEGSSGGSTPTAGTSTSEGSSTPAGAQAGSAAGQPASGSSAPGEFEIKVGGAVRKVNRDELIALAQKGEDYTRKTTELAESRKQFETDFDSRVEQAVQSQIDKLIREQEEAATRAENPPDPLAQIRTRQDMIESKIADDKLDNTLTALKKDFPLLNEQLFLLEASNAKVEKFEDLRTLAGAHQKAREEEHAKQFERIAADEKHPLSAKFRQNIIDEYLKRKEQESKSKSEVGSTGSPGGAGKPPAPKTWDEADKAALEAISKL